jgi:hypothetical protein
VALQHPGDEDLLDYYIFIPVKVLVVLYEYPVEKEALLQYMGKAAGLQQTVGDKKYQVLVATDGQHIENGKLGDIFLLTTNMFKDDPVTAQRFADALTGGDVGQLYSELKEIEGKLRVRYDKGMTG